jgi:hypothetical protein
VFSSVPPLVTPTSGLRNVLKTGLAAASPDDYVLLADAFDVWFQLPPSFLIKRFQELDADIVIGADRVCWPNAEDSVSIAVEPDSSLSQPGPCSYNYGPNARMSQNHRSLPGSLRIRACPRDILTKPCMMLTSNTASAYLDGPTAVSAKFTA